jgi:hypothetical protein
MTQAALTADLRAHAPGLAPRFGAIMADLLALIVHLLLRDPRRLALAFAAWRYINGTLRQLEVLLDRLAAGETAPPPRRTRRTAAPAEPARPPAARGRRSYALRAQRAALPSAPAADPAPSPAAAPQVSVPARPLPRPLPPQPPRRCKKIA